MAVKRATSTTTVGAQAKKPEPTEKATRAVSKTAPNVDATKAAAGKVSAVARQKAPGKATKTPAKPGAKTPARASLKTAAKATKTASASKVAATRAPAARSSSRPPRLRVRDNEQPWTAKELAKVRAELEADIVRLQGEISLAEVDLAGLMRDAGDGAGDDQADAGTATFEREQEISIANNAREMCDQSRRALSRMTGGTYGVCESCGSPIGKNRLLAFPRATLCLTCKSKQERR